MSVPNIKKQIQHMLKQIAIFEEKIKEIKNMSSETTLERTKKDIETRKLHILVLKQMNGEYKIAQEKLKREFEKLLANINSLYELLF